MGQHKHNPTAIAAAEGKLPPKEKPVSKRESENFLRKAILHCMLQNIMMENGDQND